MITTLPEGKRILTISAKCRDLFDGDLAIGSQTFEFNGYVPEGLGIGGDDYVELTIDLDTGQIVGWTPPTDEAILNAINGEDEDDDDDYDSRRRGLSEGKLGFARDDLEIIQIPLKGYDPDELPEAEMNGDITNIVGLYVEESNKRDENHVGWGAQRSVAGASLLIMGPDPDLDQITPSVACLSGDGKFLWMVIMSSSYSAIRVHPENRQYLERVDKALK